MNQSLVDLLSSIAFEDIDYDSPTSLPQSPVPDMPPHLSDLVDDSEESSKDVSQDGRAVVETLRDQIDNGEIFYDDPSLPPSEQGSRLLAEMVEECGPMPENYGPERVIIQKPGNLYRTILVSGIVTLTNHRIVYCAKIPPYERGRIIKSGMLTYHRSRLHRKRRLWAELRSDSAILYPSSSAKYEPYSVLRISSIASVELQGKEGAPACDVLIHMKSGKSAHLTLDSADAALSWLRAFEACIFTFQNSASEIKINIPLNFIVDTNYERLFDFAIVATVFIEADYDSDCANPTVLSNNDGNTQILESGMRQSFQFLATADACDFGRILAQTWSEARKAAQDRRAACIHSSESSDTVDKMKKNISHTAENFEKCKSKFPWVEDDSHVPERARDDNNEVSNAAVLASATKMKRLFGLDDTAEELTIYSCELVQNLIPTFGQLCISPEYMCFWGRRVSMSDTKIRIPLNHLRQVKKIKTYIFGVYAFEIQVLGSDYLRFDFFTMSKRNRALKCVQEAIDASRSVTMPPPTTTTTIISNELTYSPPSSTTAIDKIPPPDSPTTKSHKSSGSSDGIDYGALSDGSTAVSAGGSSTTEKPRQTRFRAPSVPITVKDNIKLPRSVNAQTPHLPRPMRIYCMAIGSRGDIQPYISLCKELVKDGHACTIVSHPEYSEWVKKHNIAFKGVGGDPAILMKLSVERQIFSASFFTETVKKFRGWLDDLLRETWQACQEAQLLIESPSTMAGIHIAEALNIPYFRAFTMPWTRTSAYPHAFAAGLDIPLQNNLMTYAVIENLFWMALSGQVNRWRKDVLKLPSTDLKKLDQNRVPFIYNFSPTVCPPPTDWRDWIHVSGYWFLDDDNDNNWEPPRALEQFLSQAKKDHVPIAYIGFGSIVVDDPVQVTETIYSAVVGAEIRAVVSRGWSARLQSDEITQKMNAICVPKEVYVVDSIPHNWLFPRIDLAVHHGGAGTTGASLRAGLPTIIKPFFGDQFFWALRVKNLSVGIKLSSLSSSAPSYNPVSNNNSHYNASTTSELQKALKKAATDQTMKETATLVGVKIRAENGTRNAIEFIYDHLDEAARLIHKKRAQEKGNKRTSIRVPSRLRRSLTFNSNTDVSGTN